MSEVPANPPKPAPERLKLEDLVTPIFDVEMARRFALARMRRLWKQSEVCIELGLNKKTMAQMELGRLPTPRHPFSLSKLEKVFGPRATNYILLNYHAHEYDAWTIESKYMGHLTKTRKPRKKGEHWTRKRLRAGLETTGTLDNIPASEWDRALDILKAAQNKHIKTLKRKDK